MTIMRAEIEIFAHENTTYDEDGEPYSSGTIEGAIIKEAARQLLGIEYIEDGEKKTHDKVQAALQRKLEQMVDERVASISQQRIEAAVDEALAKGWQKTDDFGNPKGEVFTLSKRISMMLEAAKNDGYSNDRYKTWLDRHIDSTVEAALKKEFEPIVAAAREKFRAAVDGVVQAKLTETLKAALGLR